MTPAQLIATAIVNELHQQGRQIGVAWALGNIVNINPDGSTDQVLLEGTFDFDAAGQAVIDLARLPGTWRCFHCDDVFTDRAAAAAHFGADEGRTPACQIKGSEGGLVRALREAEDECERVHTQLHAESADGLRALQNNLGRHRTALVAMEETGYERGIADHQVTVEALRALIAMVDQLDKHPSRGGGVLPMDKAKVMHAAREAAK